MTRGFVVGSYDDIVMITPFLSGLGFLDHDIAQVEGLAGLDGEVLAESRCPFCRRWQVEKSVIRYSAPGISEIRVMRPSASVPGKFQ